MQYWKWENPTNHRYYIATVTKDLFGDLLVVKGWGSSNKKGQKTATIFCETYDQAVITIEQIGKKRLSHGYLLIADNSLKRSLL